MIPMSRSLAIHSDHLPCSIKLVNAHTSRFKEAAFIMKIQYISYVDNRNFESESITRKTFSNPLAFDNFDVTVISLQNPEMWKNKESGTTSIDCIKDLHNLGQMSSASNASLILFLLPQDYTFRSRLNYGEKYFHSTSIRKILPDVTSLISKSLGISSVALSPGAEITLLGHGEYNSAFSISALELIDEGRVQRGNGNGITVYLTDDYAATTIQIDDSDSLLGFLEDIGFIDREFATYPDWLDTVPFLDESDLIDRLESKRAKIAELEHECALIEENLDEYRDKKLILCTKGSKLQDSVASMLEEILPREKVFVDEGEEDYRFETNDRAFLFEIKGSEKSLKRDHISKTDNHVQVYEDSHAEDQEGRVPKGILIFSEEIEKPPSEHLPYVETQLELAKKYGVLVIPALSFLKLYEKFHRGEVTTDQLQEKLWYETGLWLDQ